MARDTTSTTVDEYLATLPDAGRPALTAIRSLVVDHLPDGYEEIVLWGMPSYVVPLERYPDTYNGQPLAYVSFAAQKRHSSLYLMALYSDSAEDQAFRERWPGASRSTWARAACGSGSWTISTFR